MQEEDLRQYVSERTATKNANERARLVSRDLAILEHYIVAAGNAATEAEALATTTTALGAFVSQNMVRDATAKYRAAHKEEWKQREIEAAGRVDADAREVLLALAQFNGWASDGKRVETFDDAVRFARNWHSDSRSGIPPGDLQEIERG